MTMPAADIRRPRRGLALVFVAVVIFAGLSYIASRDPAAARELERNQAMAAHLAQFPAVVETAAARLMQQGIAAENLDFNPEGTGATSVFYSGAGGVAYQMPPASVAAGGVWRFLAVSADGRGYFAAGVGRDAADGKDVMLYLDGVAEKFCRLLNRRLGLPPEPRVETVPVDFTAAGEPAAAAGDNGWTFAAHKPDTAEKQAPRAACVRNGPAGRFVVYRVVAAR